MAKWSDPVGPDYATDEPEFMVGYGRAMAEWGNVEHALSRIFVRILDPGNVEWATLAFFSVQNFRDRTNMVASLVTSQFGPPDTDNPTHQATEWSRVVKAIGRTAKNRNTLAHLHVWHGPKIGTFGHGHLFQVSKLPTDPEERRRKIVTIKTLRDYSHGFHLLAKRLNDFDKSI
jgi:hypothetical protein